MGGGRGGARFRRVGKIQDFSGLRLKFHVAGLVRLSWDPESTTVETTEAGLRMVLVGIASRAGEVEAEVVPSRTEDLKGLGFGVWGFGFGVLGLGFGVWGYMLHATQAHLNW